LEGAATGSSRNPASNITPTIGDLPIGAPEAGEFIGSRVGPYTIQALIGRGGMGAVYRAVREDVFRMEVAIKLLKRGTPMKADTTQSTYRC